VQLFEISGKRANTRNYSSTIVESTNVDTKWPLKRDFTLADMDRALPDSRRIPSRGDGKRPEDGAGVTMATTIPQ